MIGRCAWLMRLAACWIDAMSIGEIIGCIGFAGRVCEPGVVALYGKGVRRMPAVTSLGKSTNTGPGRPEVAILNASLIRLGSSDMSFTMTFHLVQLREIPMTSASWKASEPIAEVATWPQKTTRGTPSERASCIGVTTLVAP